MHVLACTCQALTPVSSLLGRISTLSGSGEMRMHRDYRWLVFTLLVLGLASRIRASSRAVQPAENSQDDMGPCPKECICQGTSIDCSYRGLLAVPADIPTTTGRL